MELVGVYHLEIFLPDVVDYIDERFPHAPNSLMLELPLNWNEIRTGYRGAFFYQLEKIYAERGSRIIFGDRARKMSVPRKNTTTDILARILTDVWYYVSTDINGTRDEAMKEAVMCENPEAVVVGRQHAAYLKSRFPDAHYTAFKIEFDPRHQPLLYLASRIFPERDKPDRTIPIRYAL